MERQMHLPLGDECPRREDIDAQAAALADTSPDVIGMAEYCRRGLAIAEAEVQYYEHWQDTPLAKMWRGIRDRWRARLRTATHGDGKGRAPSMIDTLKKEGLTQ